MLRQAVYQGLREDKPAADKKPKYEEIAVDIEVPRHKPTGTVVLRGAKVITMRGEEVILDSDIVFFRDFDLARFEYPNSIPLLTMANEVTPDQPWHSRWVDTSHQLLGLSTPPFPAADFIGHIIFWDKQTTRALIARIEEVTGVEWIEALCRTHEFAEYMLYGYFVQNDPASALRHAAVPTTPCVSYWDDPTLSKTDLSWS